MQTSEDHWQGFFRGAQIVLDAAAKADSALRLQLGTGFRLFDWIRPGENALSDMLRDLLDPVGSHGQGSTFLRLALSHLFPIPHLSLTDQLASCVVIREALTSTGRLIDLVIDFGDFGVGIENKPFAAEQKEQLSDYAEQLRRRFGGRFCLVFLHGPGMAATSIDLAQKQQLQVEYKFLEIPYYAENGPSLYHWLTQCANAARSEKVRFFITDFAAYVAEQFGSIKGEIKQ